MLIKSNSLDSLYKEIDNFSVELTEIKHFLEQHELCPEDLDKFNEKIN